MRSVKHLFSQRYPMEFICDFWIKFGFVENGKVSIQEAMMSEKIWIDDVIISAHKTSLAFKIRVDNFGDIRWSYSDEKGQIHWDLQNKFIERFKNLLNYLGNPKILLDVLNEDDPVKLYRPKLTL
jgi:hypothetical protein